MKKFVTISAAMLVALSMGGTAAADDIKRAQGGYNPPPAKKGFRYPDCFCTDSQGKRVELGKTTCLQIGSRQYMARCSMSLNNPTWRREGEGCPSV